MLLTVYITVTGRSGRHIEFMDLGPQSEKLSLEMDS